MNDAIFSYSTMQKLIQTWVLDTDNPVDTEFLDPLHNCEVDTTIITIREARMARKQNGSYNASINVQTPIAHLVANSTHPETVRSALWHCPNITVALKFLVNVVRVTNLEVVKIVFRQSSSFSLSSSASLAP